MTALNLPRRSRGRPTAAAEAEFDAKLAAFCAAITEIRARLDFDVGARGWCYILEEHGLGKGDFDNAEKLICECRKNGRLPLNIVAEDGAREFANIESIDSNSPEEEAESIIEMVQSAPTWYTPRSFWDFQDFYVEMLVEKIDLKNLFAPVCAEYNVPIGNARGCWDLNSRAGMMRRFADKEAEGKRCVLLYCGDHDPSGLSISTWLRNNMNDLSGAVGWRPDNLMIKRFGLNLDFIKKHKLTWIDGLETGSGMRLDDPDHQDHEKRYVQEYIAQHGARKVEANALVVRPKAGRDLCRKAILQYINTDAIPNFHAAVAEAQSVCAAEVARILAKRRRSA